MLIHMFCSGRNVCVLAGECVSYCGRASFVCVFIDNSAPPCPSHLVAISTNEQGGFPRRSFVILQANFPAEGEVLNFCIVLFFSLSLSPGGAKFVCFSFRVFGVCEDFFFFFF